MIVLAQLASATSRVRLGIGIYMLALRDPVLVGKTLATLDLLSGGRIDMAVGLGWTADEYSFTGNNWKTRGRRMNEMIRALRVLWEDEHPEFHGEFFDFGPWASNRSPATPNADPHRRRRSAGDEAGRDAGRRLVRAGRRRYRRSTRSGA